MEFSSLAAVLHSPLLLAVLVLVFSCLIVSSIKRTPPSCGDGGRRLPLPPSSPGVPLLGHLPLLGSLPHRKLRSMAEAHGPVMLLRFGRVPTVVASSAAAAEEVMKTRDLAFASRPRVRMAERLVYGRDMAFAPYGEFWRQARRVTVLHLLSPRRVLSFRGVREQEVAALLDRVRRRGGGGGETVNLSDLLMSYAHGVISRSAFGDGAYGFDGDEGGEKLRKLFADFGGLLGTMTVGEFVPWLAWVDKLTGLDAKAARTSAAMDALLERVIADHRERRRSRGQSVGDGEAEADHRDFVDVSEAKEGGGAGGVLFDTVAIKAVILDMMAAGTESSFTTTEWVMAELINHPPIMRKLQDEIRAAVGASGAAAAATGGQVTEDHLGKLPFLRAVIKEMLRLHAPGPLLLPRETVEDTQLLGHRVPARTRVVINAWAIGRDKAAWGDRAEEFVPERWLEGGGAEMVVEYAAQLGQDFRFVPFGAGRRGCPGVGFAALSVELALANLLYHFDWELPPPPASGITAATTRLDMGELFGLSMRLKADLNLVAKPWSPGAS